MSLFMSIIFAITFWTIVSPICYFFSKFTTIGTKNWFSDLVFKVEHFVKFKLKLNKLAFKILPLSYSKIFICRPCHTFWLCLVAHSFKYELLYSIYAALIAYAVAKNIERNAIKEQNERAVN